MKLDVGSLKRFERQVRLVRAWRGLAVGLCIGGVACAVWSVLDWAKIAYTEWIWMGSVLLGCGLSGLIVGLFLRIPAQALADSIDRRGRLANRLSTSMEIDDSGEFGQALQHDAAAKVAGLKPGELFPVRVGRWQGAAIGLAFLASGIFLLGNTPLLLPPQERKDREELKKVGAAVERIAKPLTEPTKSGDMTPAEKRMADELRKLQRDLQRQKVSKEEASQKANDLSKQTQELTKERSELTSQNLEKAESALEKMQKAELEKNGIKMDAEMMKQLHEMNKENQAQQKNGQQDPKAFGKKMEQLNEQQKGLQQQHKALEQKQEALKSELSKIGQQLKSPNLTPEQKKALEEMQKKIQEMLKGLEKEIAEIQKAVQKIMQDKQIQELMKKINEHPMMKKLQEMAAKLAENATMGKQGEIPKITKEDLEELKKQLPEMEAKIKELAKQLQDPKALDEYMEQLREALENMDKLELNMGVCIACMSLFNLPLPGLPSPSNPIDFMGVDTKKVNHNENGKQGEGSTTLTQIKGQKRDTGDEAYVEIKGPTSVGNRSGVKYTKVLPSYRKKAEEAIAKKTIPKQHEKRVKEYFESLAGGK
jgi:myosin heavy subunit